MDSYVGMPTIGVRTGKGNPGRIVLMGVVVDIVMVEKENISTPELVNVNGRGFYVKGVAFDETKFHSLFSTHISVLSAKETRPTD